MGHARLDSEGAITPRLDNGSTRRRLLRPATETFHRRRSRGSFWPPRHRLAPAAGSLRSRRAVLSSLHAVALFGCEPHITTHARQPTSGTGQGLRRFPIHAGRISRRFVLGRRHCTDQYEARITPGMMEFDKKIRADRLTSLSPVRLGRTSRPQAPRRDFNRRLARADGRCPS